MGEGLRYYTNGGPQELNMVGEIDGYDTVWYNPESLANILFLARVATYRRVIIDTTKEHVFHVHNQDGAIMKSKKSDKLLYSYDIRWNKSYVTYLNAVNDKKSTFSRGMIKRADEAQIIYDI